MSTSKWSLTKEDQKKYILALTDSLSALRAKADISQGDLAYLIGISRQTYSAIESKKRMMSWTTYLSLILFFNSIITTHDMLHNLAAYPKELVDRFNEGHQIDNTNILGQQPEELNKMIQALDDQGKHSLKTVLMVEYARCNKISGETVVKAFNGIDFSSGISETDVKISKALWGIKKK